MPSRVTVLASGAAAISGGALIVAASLAPAQPAMPKPTQDYKAAPAGAYALDPLHTGVIARVPHLGFSYSVERFTTSQGTLNWDPANPAASKLTASVDPASITPIPVPGRDFAGDLAKMLNAAKFPTASFTSTTFTADGPTHGKVDGDLTVMGVTKHVTFDATLIGAGKGFRGPVIGVSARTSINAGDYGLPPFITGPIELTIDTEFDAKAG